MEISLSLLKNLVEAIGALGKAMSAIADGCKHLAITAADGYDAVQARITYKKLIKQSAKLSKMIRAQYALTSKLRSYAREARRYTPVECQAKWTPLKKDIQTALLAVLTTLHDLDSLGGLEFVTKPTYHVLGRLLGMPSVLLHCLLDSDPPSAPEQLQALAEAAESHARLVAEVERAREALNTYIKSLKSPNT